MRLAYRHDYHAGNFADVVKHCVLIALLDRMKTPMTYVDTHAGAGWYEKSSSMETATGVSLLLGDREYLSLPDEARRLADLTSDDYYPGSPAIAASMARSGDTLAFVEKDSDVASRLSAFFPEVSVVVGDGYDFSKRSRNGRALVFCDPPYQLGGDNERAISMIEYLQTHWKAARVALWYPVRPATDEKTHRLLDSIRTLKSERRILSDCLSARIYSGDDRVGTGILLVNPPYGIQQHLEILFADLAEILLSPASPDRGADRIFIEMLE